jgi:1-deoxy-D-xylulose-5-phosphate synthase
MAPSDERELVRCLDLATSIDFPVQLRYPRDNVPPAPLGEDSAGTLTRTGGKSRTLRDGADATIIAYGSLAWQALEAANLLENEGLNVAVVDARFCKPLDGEMLARVFSKGTPILTVEDHSVVNGFGTAVVEHAAEKRYDSRLVTRLGLPDRWIKHASRSEQLKEVGLDATGIASSVRAAIQESKRIPAEATPLKRSTPALRN